MICTHLNGEERHGETVSSDVVLNECLAPRNSGSLGIGRDLLLEPVGPHGGIQGCGVGDFYSRVWTDRPEIFFKATPNRVVGPGKAFGFEGSTLDVFDGTYPLCHHFG